MSPTPPTPYGSWKSPITADLIVSGTISISQPQADGYELYWLEMRPAEGGRTVLVRLGIDGVIRDVTPPTHNVRSRVHEYGGGAYLVEEGTAYFSNFVDQRIYRQDPGALPRPITADLPLRYADYVADRRRQRLICVREDHRPADREAINTLVSVGMAGDEQEGQVLASGNDFYAFPRLSPDGSQLSWLTWNHPNMPWDGTELWVADVRLDGKLGAAKRIAGGRDESVFQPTWSPDGVLYFASDRTGWWNLYRWLDGHTEPLCPLEAEFGLPQWQFGMSTFAFESSEYIVCAYSQRGSWQLARLHTRTGERHLFYLPYTQISSPLVMPDKRIVFIGASTTEMPALIRLDRIRREFQFICQSNHLTLDSGYFSAPHAINFPTTQGETAHAFFYPPTNKDYVAPRWERPPLLVISHGGPTSVSSNSLSLNIQYWTSRGFAVLDVNYRGSTGYGREYWQKLYNRWGIADTDDCLYAAKYLITQGKVDANRLAIRGGSAGGFTTLSALTFRHLFHAGASYYGVSDLEALALETHKFESRYLNRLIAPYPAQRHVYVERSPIHAVEKLSCPVIFFQGLDDKVVLPNQTEKMVEALRQRGIPVAYLPFAGEGHGFRRAETLKRALEAELYFYSRIFKFDLAEVFEPVEIANLE